MMNGLFLAFCMTTYLVVWLYYCNAKFQAWVRSLKGCSSEPPDPVAPIQPDQPEQETKYHLQELINKWKRLRKDK